MFKLFMKKKILIILLFLINVSLFVNVNANNNDTYFVVTAYYSPLPNQEHYSYSVYTKRERTYEEEKRLQWEWIRWASWKKVFSWMLAAPKNYKFWTKIYLEWLGVWEVADRWWAIVNKGVRWHNYDRIDIWVWYGDEWLERATYWWKRTIKWSILNKGNIVDLDYSKISLIKWKRYNLSRNINIFNHKLTKKEEFIKLQNILNELWYYKWEIDWQYASIKESILNFQLNNKVVESKNTPWAWNYWPITRSKLKSIYNEFLIKKEKRLKKELEEKIKLEKYKKELSMNISKKIEVIWKPKFWDISPNVRELQLLLKEVWYFDFKDTAIFWNITKKNIIKFQLDHWLIKNENDLWAWYFWPKTRKAIKDKFLEIKLNQLTKKENEIIKI